MNRLAVILSLFFSTPAHAALSADSCKAKIKAAYAARTGKTLAGTEPNLIVDLCQGIIDEIKANAQVQPGIPVSTAGGPASQTGSTTGPGTIQ